MIRLDKAAEPELKAGHECYCWRFSGSSSDQRSCFPTTPTLSWMATECYPPDCGQVVQRKSLVFPACSPCPLPGLGSLPENISSRVWMDDKGKKLVNKSAYRYCSPPCRSCLLYLYVSSCKHCEPIDVCLFSQHSNILLISSRFFVVCPLRRRRSAIECL